MNEQFNQRKDIAQYLERFGSITSLEAINAFHITRLSSVIYDLRHKGYCIESVPIEVTTKYGTTRIAKYILREPYFIGREENKY